MSSAEKTLDMKSSVDFRSGDIDTILFGRGIGILGHVLVGWTQTGIRYVAMGDNPADLELDLRKRLSGFPLIDVDAEASTGSIEAPGARASDTVRSPGIEQFAGTVEPAAMGAGPLETLAMEPGVMQPGAAERGISQSVMVNGSSRPAKVVIDVIRLVEARERSLEVALDLRGTDFQDRVWRALLDIPRGRMVSYSEIAYAIGRPGSARAVAGACAANLIAGLVPCHRVVGSDGRLTGYRWGIERKKMLLALEARVDVRSDSA